MYYSRSLAGNQFKLSCTCYGNAYSTCVIGATQLNDGKVPSQIFELTALSYLYVPPKPVEMKKIGMSIKLFVMVEFFKFIHMITTIACRIAMITISRLHNSRNPCACTRQLFDVQLAFQGSL